MKCLIPKSDKDISDILWHLKHHFACVKQPAYTPAGIWKEICGELRIMFQINTYTDQLYSTGYSTEKFSRCVLTVSEVEYFVHQHLDTINWLPPAAESQP